ncbi:MAG: ATP-binding protein [Dehalococcoidia bacterium]
MQRSIPSEPTPPRGSSVYQQIVENARVATKARFVVLTIADLSRGRVWTEATAGFGSRTAARALKAAQLVVPNFDPAHVELDVHVNPVQEAVFLRGEAVSAPFKEVAAKVVPNAILQIVTNMLRVKHSYVHPLFAQGAVVGSLSFHSTVPVTYAAQRVFDAFASQTSLTLENAGLVSALQERMRELKTTRRLVSASNEAVRRSLAETLHGPVQTQLLVADFSLRRAAEMVVRQPNAARSHIEEARELIDRLRQNEIREVSHLLHPSVIRLGVGPAIRSLADRYRKVMHVTLEIDPRLDDLSADAIARVPEHLRLVAYRVIEEAMVNAHVHGSATDTRLRVSLGKGRTLALEVADNGTGFDQSMSQMGLGLHTISLQISEAEGEWSIESRPDGGTVLKASLPVPGLPAPDTKQNRTARPTVASPTKSRRVRVTA